MAANALLVGFLLWSSASSLLPGPIDVVVRAYNLDVSMPVIFEDPGIGGRWNGRDSYFGFSVALHNFTDKVASAELPKTWLLVGAPRANYSSQGYPPNIAAKQPIIEPGTLYKCSLWAELDGCTEVTLDSFENGYQFLKGDAVAFTYLKDNGWVGVSLDAQPGDEGRIVVSPMITYSSSSAPFEMKARSRIDAYHMMGLAMAYGACGHLWKQQLLDAKTKEPQNFLPNGICYWIPARALAMDRYDAVGRLAPLMAPDMQIVHLEPPYQRTEYVYGLGQAGTTINLPRSNPGEIIMGAPGAFSWRGTAVRLSDTAFINATSAASPAAIASDLTTNSTTIASQSQQLDNSMGNPPKNLKQSIPFGSQDIPQLIGTPNISIGDMWGYAVASGVFTRDGDTLYLMTAPRAAFTGRAFVHDYPPPGAPETDPLPVKWYFSGRQGGEYFGGSVCVTDVNSDGLDDVLIGAPLHSATNNEGAVAPDQGKVYVFLNNEESFHDFPDQELFGNRATGARFGYAISAIGDIDRDGFNDVAVGAPYENGQGAVYVYLGSRDGLSLVPQVVQGSLLSPALKGFGVSISRGIDMDRNSYPDLAVGAFLSGHAVVLRSKPVIKVSGMLVTSKARISINDTTSPFHVDACLSYSGKEAPKTIVVEAIISADFSYAVPRVSFITGTKSRGSSAGHSQHVTYRQSLDRGVQTCEKFAMQFIPYVKDFSKALEIRLTYELVDSSQAPRNNAEGANSEVEAPLNGGQTSADSRPVWITYDGGKDGKGHKKTASLGDFCKTCPVADPRWPRQTKVAVPFLNDCGDDGCITDLSITATWVDIDTSKPLVIGSRNSAIFAVTVKAKLEPAFIPKAIVHLPNHILLTSLPRNCMEDKQSDRTIVECELPGPMYSGQEATVHLGIDLSAMRAWMTDLRISMAVQSISEERHETRSDNTFDLILPLQAQADIAVRGESQREHFYYLAKEDRPEKERGKANYFEVAQFYQITKHLPTPVDVIIAELRFPVAVIGPLSLPKNETVFLQVVTPSPTQGQYYDHEVECRLTDAQNRDDWVKKSIKAPVKKRHHWGQPNLLIETTDVRSEWNERTAEGVIRSSKPLKKMFTQDISSETITDGLPAWRTKLSASSSQGGLRGTHNGRANLDSAASQDVTFVNCTSGSYKCQAVTCAITNFGRSGSSASLGFKLKIDLSILEPWLGKNKTVVLVTEAVVRFGDETADVESLRKFDKRPDSGQVVTVFSPVTQIAHKNIPTWVIATSVAGGILLLLLIIMGLMKAGFFHRSQLDKINQLKAEDELLNRMTQEQRRVDGDGDSLPPPRPAEPSLSMIVSPIEIVDAPTDDGSTANLTVNEH